jgi:hypothetical protein
MLGMLPPRRDCFVRFELDDGELLAVGGRECSIRHEPRHLGGQFGHPGIHLLIVLADIGLDPSAKDDDNHEGLLSNRRLSA